jgi:hypothetical protein
MRSCGFLNLLLIAALLLAAVATPGVSAAATVSSDPSAVLSKIEPLVLDEIAAGGQTEFFVWMVEQADLSPADQLQTKQEKGQFVFNALVETAERTQKDLRAYLDAQRVEYQAFYIANKILVRGGDQALVMDLAARDDVARIAANHQFQLQEPFDKRPAPAGVTAVEPNVIFINADDVWALGYDGGGTVMAGNDTGLDEDHPAIAPHYRGCLNPPACTSEDHNYNWWDATGTYPTDPWDGHGHGTHTTGTMVGDDGGSNQIGVAPGAQTVHCKNMTDGGSGDDGTFTECFQWDLAPWDLNGQNPNPDLAPDAINNSWGYFGGGQNQFRDEIQALHAAGILVEVSAGGEAGCGSLRSPADYWEVLTTGSVNHAGGNLPGTLSGFSARGPSSLDPTPPYYFPDIMAPGENIRSCLPGNSYGSWSGTSMAGPHATALVGLMWSACPSLQGRVEDTIQLIQETAVPLTGQNGSNCGGDYTVGPNNDWGFGTIDALAAVNAVLAQCGGLGTLDGHVYDLDTELPLEDATVEATLSPTQTWQASTDDQGYYEMTVLTGTYTVEASKYAYIPAVIATEVFSGVTTTEDFYLEPAASYLVYGWVTDANRGWPLHAGIEIAGYPYGTVWTDPATGYYEVMLPESSTYDFAVEAWVAGYLPESRPVGPVVGDTQEDFALDVDTSACVAPGYTPTYYFWDDFEAGLGNWTATGLWNEENEGDPCGSLVPPFPSSDTAAYYGQDGICNFDVGTNSGELTLVTPVPLPPTGAALSLWSYEETECGGDCGYDNRYVEISVDGGVTWNLLGEGNTEDTWYKLQYNLAAYAGNDALFRFRFDSVDSVANSYFGWMVDDVAVATGCEPNPGGLAVGYVYDLNTSDPLDGADVWKDNGEAMVTGADGFYTLFSPPGLHGFWATADGYGTETATLDIVDGTTVQHDFYLGAGYLEWAPIPLQATLDMGASTVVPGTLANTGTADAFFEMQEVDRGFIPMGFEEDTGVLCWSAYTGQGKLRIIDSGNSTLVGAFPSGNETDCLASETDDGDDVPWLSEDPVSGTVPLQDSVPVDVTFDAGVPQITQPGDYYATLRIENDTIYGPLQVPVTLTVVAPVTYGKLTGVVAGLGYCDDETYLLADAEVMVEDEISVTSDASGLYVIWLEEGIYTVTASAEDHTSASAEVTITAQQTTTQDLELRSMQPCMSVTPDSMSVALQSGDTWSEMLTLVNDGAGDSGFKIKEVEGGYIPPLVSIPRFEGEIAPDAAPPSIGRDPNAPQPTGDAGPLDFPLAGEPAFAMDIYPGYNLVRIPDTTVPGTWNIIGNIPGSNYFAGDFLGGDFSQLFVLDYATNSLYSVDSATAVPTLIGPAAPGVGESWTGATGATDGTLYASATTCAASTLYSVDPASGAVTTIGPITNGPCIIDIAINAVGELYGVDIVNDMLVQIDPNTGAGTVVGSVGINANYAQGMDLEEETGVLYWAAYSTSGELRIIDTNTGASTPVGAFPGGAETDCLAFETGGAGADVPWLSEDPISGTVPADGTFDVEVTFTAPLTTGLYMATLLVDTDDAANPEFQVPVQMEVQCVEVGDVAVSVLNTDPIYPGDPVEFDADIMPDNFTGSYSYTIDYGDDMMDEGASSDDPLLFEHAYAEPGTYLVEVAAWNCDMTEPVVGTVEVVVEAVPCTEVVTMTLSMLTPYPIYMGDRVDFEADIVPDDFTGPLSYTIDYGDGMTEEGSTSDDPMAFSHAFVAAGTMRVQVEIWNCGMEVPVSDWMDVEVAAPMFYIYLPLSVKDAE